MIDSPTSTSGYVRGVLDDLYCIVRNAAVTSSCSKTHVVMVVAPLLEEMNTSRLFITALCRKLQNAGISSILVDLYGTGDSCGQLADANWRLWKNDLVHVLKELHQKEHVYVSLFSIRSGCLLLNEVVEELNENLFNSIVYLAPEFSGENVINRWVRATYFSDQLKAKKYKKRDEIWSEIHNGSSLTFAGFSVPQGIITGLMSSVLSDSALNCSYAHRFLHRSQRTAYENNNKNSFWITHFFETDRFWMQDEYFPDQELIRQLVIHLENNDNTREK